MKFIDKIDKDTYVEWEVSDFTNTDWGTVYTSVFLVFAIPTGLLLLLGWICGWI